MEYKLYEIVCARYGQKSYNCPYVKRGVYCVNCGECRFLPREFKKTEEEEEEEVTEKSEETNDNRE